MAAPFLYTRLVASLPADVAPAAVDAVIELARALGVELQAVLLEDVATLALAELPSPRAFDPRVSLWRDVGRGELQRELELASAALRRRLEAARSAGLHMQVTIARGAPGAMPGGSAQATDLMVVTEPADPMARFVQPFAGLLQASLAAPAALLYLPHRGARSHGPIAALGAGAASELAQRLAQALGAPRVDVKPAEPSAHAPALRALLPQLQERRVRVVVCGRAALGAQPQRTLQDAGDRRLAVLLAPASEENGIGREV
jgi:hypothetical protein